MKMTVEPDQMLVFQHGSLAAKKFLLEQRGEFFPFAIAVDLEGKPGIVGAADDGKGGTDVQCIAQFLKAALRENRAQYRAVGLVFNGLLSGSRDAIVMDIESRTHSSFRVAVPYRLSRRCNVLSVETQTPERFDLEGVVFV